MDFGIDLGPVSIKNAIKNQCKNQCRKSTENLCQKLENQCHFPSKMQSKINAKINAEKVSKMMRKSSNMWGFKGANSLKFVGFYRVEMISVIFEKDRKFDAKVMKNNQKLT